MQYNNLNSTLKVKINQLTGIMLIKLVLSKSQQNNNKLKTNQQNVLDETSQS